MQKKKVAYYLNKFLPFTETFVKKRIDHLRVFEPKIFYRRAAGMIDDVAAPKEKVGFPYLFGLYRKIKEYAPALIVAHFASNGVEVLPVAKLLKIPLVVFFHGMDVYPFLNQPVSPPMILRRAGIFVFANCRFMLDKLIENRFLPQLCAVDYVGTDLQKFQLKKYPESKDTLDLVMIGRDVEKKGFIYAFKALEEMDPADRKKILLHLVAGAGDKIRSYVSSHELAENVKFYPAMGHGEISAFLQRMDILLVPSVTAANEDRDGVPNVAQEAAACGLPLIASHHGGLPETVDDGVGGFLVKERDFKAIADKIEFFLKNRGKIKEMGINARRKMEKDFDIVKNVGLMEEKFLALLGGTNGL